MVKSSEKVRLDFMTYQMALLESKLEGREETLLEILRSIMKKLNMSAEKAMDFLEIPEDKRNRLLMFLNKNQDLN